MNAIPLVSVLMTCYNRATFMRQAIESVLAQTFSDFEFVIVDHGSQDDAVYATAQEYAARDPRIVLHREPENRGVSAGKHCVLQLARGRYVATLEDDDWWHVEKLQKQVAFMQANPNVGFCSCSRMLVDADGQAIAPTPLPDHIAPKSTDIADIEGGKCGKTFLGSGWIARRDILLQCGGYRSFFTLADDVDIFLRMEETGDTAAQADCLVFYRVWQGNTGSRDMKMARLYVVAAEISACHRRMGLQDPVTHQTDVDSFLLRYFYPCDFGSDRKKWHVERNIARSFLCLRKYGELRRFLRDRPSRAKPHILRLYVKIFLWSIKFNRLGFWTGAASKQWQ